MIKKEKMHVSIIQQLLLTHLSQITESEFKMAIHDVSSLTCDNSLTNTILVFPLLKEKRKKRLSWHLKWTASNQEALSGADFSHSPELHFTFIPEIALFVGPRGFSPNHANSFASFTALECLTWGGVRSTRMQIQHFQL